LNVVAVKVEGNELAELPNRLQGMTSARKVTTRSVKTGQNSNLGHDADFVAVEQQLRERSPERVPMLSSANNATDAGAHFANLRGQVHELVATEGQGRQVTERRRE
jgi:hypothetical protein